MNICKACIFFNEKYEGGWCFHEEKNSERKENAVCCDRFKMNMPDLWVEGYDVGYGDGYEEGEGDGALEGYRLGKRDQEIFNAGTGK